MTSRTAKLITSLLMVTSLLILALSHAGVLPAAADTGAALSTIVNGSATAATGSKNHSTPAVSPISASSAALRPLPIDLTDPQPTPAQGMRKWPASSCIPIVHKADLSAYLGQSAGEKPLQGITVILDPGHGGQDGGTCYPASSSNPEIIEKKIALNVALVVRDLLQSLGAKVCMTREKDEWLSVYNRVAQASRLVLNQFAAELPGQGFDSTAIAGLMPQLEAMIRINSDTVASGGRGLMKGVGATAEARLLLDIQDQYPDVLFLSLHCNAMGDNSQTGGLQVFYQTNDSNYKKETSYVRYQPSSDNPPAYMSYNDADRLKLANCLYTSILNQLPQLSCPGNSGSLTGDYAITREVNLVSALVEMGFVTSPTDRAILKDPEGQRKIAQGVANAVLTYYCG